MKITETNIADLLIFEPKIHGDSRGYFFESFNNENFIAKGLNFRFIQDNEAKSQRGVLRGLHFQNPPYAQTKLIRVIQGEILDVVVDLRRNSLSYGQSFSIVLDENNKKQLLVPKGFAHAYVVLSNEAIVAYKVDEKYMPSYEDGILWNDPSLLIDWKIDEKDIILSDKDKTLKKFNELNSPFI